MARRQGSLADFALDCTTSPEKVAPTGITLPPTRVAIVRLASTFTPTGVVPATTFWRIVTGNSCAATVSVVGVFDWAMSEVKRKRKTKIKIPGWRTRFLAGTLGFPWQS